MDSIKMNDIDEMVEVAHFTLFEAERKFRKACAQINLLNARLDGMRTRYQNAKRNNYNRFRYNMRLKLAVTEGVRNMYYEYARVQAEQVATLRENLFGEVVQIIDDDEEEMEEAEVA